MEIHELAGRQVVLAASGGLDSCTITRWLADQNVDVICMTADLGQPDEDSIGAIGERLLACGALDFVGIPLEEELAEIGLAAIQGMAFYEGGYWNTTPLGRQVLVTGIVAEMQRRGLTILSHGATGRGNDQVRFERIAGTLAPEIFVYAPWRDRKFLSAFSGRADMIRYCQARHLPIRASAESPYSTDANLLGYTCEGGDLEVCRHRQAGGYVSCPGDRMRLPEMDARYLSTSWLGDLCGWTTSRSS